MENAVLWQSLCTLGNIERKHLGQWLASPFFCRKPQPKALFDYLQQCLVSGATPTNLDAAKACQAADQQALRLTMSELLGQLEQFLVYQLRFGQSANFSIDLATVYRKRGLDKHFQRALRQARSEWDRQPFRHAAYFEAQSAIEYEQYQSMSAGSRTEALNLQDLFDATDTAFLARKLRQACFALSHQTVYKADYRLGLLDTLLDYLEQTPEALSQPAVALYYYCFLFLSQAEKAEHFVQFKAMLLAQAGLLPPDEQRDLHLLAINYCIRKINQLEQRYFREALDLYQSALRADLLLENGVLSHFAFNNIVAIALKVGESGWAEQFILSHAGYLEKKYREANVQLNQARVAYVRRDYRQALLHLQEADYSDLINNLIAKTLLLKIYFETAEFDALDAHLQSMQSFLRRQRVIGYHKSNYQNIIRYTRKLMLLQTADRGAREQFLSQIEAENPLTEKEWLEEMARNR